MVLYILKVPQREKGTEISVDRETATPAQSGAATLLRWKLKDALKGGKELMVTFRVVVQ